MQNEKLKMKNGRPRRNMTLDFASFFLHFSFCIVLLLPLLLAACSAPLVNIPPLPGDVASHDPNSAGVLAVEVTALNHVLRRWAPAGGIYAIELPPGTTNESYQSVIKQLPPGASTSEQYGGELPTYRIVQVYMRGAHARVDVIKPDDVAGEQLVSVFEAVDISGWYAQRSRLWNIPVDDALRVMRDEPRP